jgi:arsenite methyltransferase
VTTNLSDLTPDELRSAVADRYGAVAADPAAGDFGFAVGPGGRAVGIDVAAPMVERARRTVAVLGLANAEVRCAPADATGLPGAFADCVLVNGLLNLSPSKDDVLREIARVLRPGGRLVLAETTLRAPLPPGAVRTLDDWFR